MYQADNAVIMAAGTSSRFAPLSYEYPKALVSVKGEILIERQIRQLQEAEVPEIYVVTGYKAEMLTYLKEKFGVKLIHNPDYLTRNNNASIYAVKDILRNSYVCSADNYFSKNPFEKEVSDCYYAALYADGPTKEWCMQSDENGVIRAVTIGGKDAWYMLGHTFWSEKFSKTFLDILEREYQLPETADLLWESIFMDHLNELEMTIRPYPGDAIFEFDTLDELRAFDPSYLDNTRSHVIDDIATQLGCRQQDMTCFTAYRQGSNSAAGFTFLLEGTRYEYAYESSILRRI